MALSDRNIVITPNKGKSADPSIAFSGANATVGAQTIYANVYPFNGGTISFEASSGQLFSISNSLSGTIFSVNDVSGMPSISVNSNGTILLAPYGGKVGIGTASSVGMTSNTFSLYGTAMVYGNIDFGNPAGGTSGIYFNDGTYLTTAASYFSYGTPGTVQFAGTSNAFNGDSSTFFWDNTNKRLGIGTATPSNTLSVWGSTPGWFNTSNGADIYEVVVGNTTSTSTTIGYAAAATTPYGYLTATASATKNITFNSLGYIGIGGTTLPKNTLDVAGRVVIGATYAGNANYTGPANGLAVQGSVGVGTNGPAGALDVNGWAGFRQGLSAAGAVTVASLTSNGAVGGTTGVFSTSLYAAAFNTAGTATVASLNSNGAVNATSVTITAAAANANLYLNSSGGTGRNFLINSSTGGALVFYDATATLERMRMDSWGNVSIGTTTVFYQSGGRISLSVNGTSQSIIAVGTGGTQRGYMFHDGTNMYMQADTGSFFMTTPGANPLLFRTNNTERVRIAATGEVGIGNITPVSTLDVNGIASFRSAVSVAGATAVASLTSNGTITASTFANGAATVNMFTSDTATNTFNIATAATASGATKTVNLGTGGAAGSTTTINIGDADGGTTTVNSPSLVIPGNMSVGANILATTGPILTLSALIGGGTGYMNGTHTNQTLSGGTGAYMLSTVVVSLGVVTGITLTWGGHRYSAGDVLTVGSLSTTLATTAASGTGTAATLTFAAQAAAPFQVGAQIIVAGVTPTGYNGTYTVTGCTTTTVTYANATTGAQTVAGTVKMGAALTNSTISVATIQGTDVYVSSYISDSLGARLRLEANDTSVVAGQEFGAIAFSSRDADWRSSGDLALIKGVAVGTTGGSDIQFWTAAAGEAPNLSAVVTSAGNFRMYNAAGTFYSELSNSPTANRTVTIPDIAGTVALIQSAATAGYFDTSATTPTGTTRLNYGGYFYPTFINLSGSGDTATAATHYYVETGSDGFVRPKTLANVKTEIVTTAAVASAVSGQTVTAAIYVANGTDTTAKFQAAPASILSTSYNYVLGATNDTGSKLIMFVNGSARSTDGGVNAATIRNDGGAINFGSTSFATNMYGTTITIDAVTQINLAATTYITGGTGSITLNATGDITCYRSGGTTGVIYLTSSGTRYLYFDATNYILNGAGLTVGGAIGAAGEITAYSSDYRLKNNIQLIADPLGKLKALRGVMFDWDTDKVAEFGFDPKHKHDVGVIAQEVEAVLPEAVRPAPFDTESDGSSKSGEKYLTVQYEKLTALLIEAVKDQQVMIDELRNRVTSLESKLEK